MPRGISVYQSYQSIDRLIDMFYHEVNAYFFSLVILFNVAQTKLLVFSPPKENYLSDDVFHKKNDVSSKIHIPF